MNMEMPSQTLLNVKLGWQSTHVLWRLQLPCELNPNTCNQIFTWMLLLCHVLLLLLLLLLLLKGLRVVGTNLITCGWANTGCTFSRTSRSATRCCWYCTKQQKQQVNYIQNIVWGDRAQMNNLVSSVFFYHQRSENFVFINRHQHSFMRIHRFSLECAVDKSFGNCYQ